MMNPLPGRERYDNRQLIAAIKNLIPGRIVTLSNRVRLHPGYEEWNRHSRFVRLGTTVGPKERSALSRQITDLIWAAHSGSVWYAPEWDNFILTIILDKNGD